ncbi:MAG: S46 family peptidase [Vicinamibacterales bacterium]
MSRRLLAVWGILSVLLFVPAAGEEGMYPITELSKLDLKAKGLKIDPATIYNPKGTSLIEAIVSLGGCSASFVSNDGLIITNHHCVFGAVQAASTAEKDYLTDGFLARTRADEIRARGLTARITEQMRDVSAEVLSAVTASMTPLERARAIEDRRAELTRKAEAEFQGKTVSISEMLPGKSYLMFISTTYRDVRLVYVPPRSIGEFGGEDDNWMWPRHTGDFSFVRAYAGPGNAPADYAPDNVPYHPKRFLKVNPNGVNEEDFVFILGYPGRTYRHQTAAYMAYEENYRMPFVADLNAWQISTLEEIGRESRATALKFDSRIKGLANTMKNYRGKLVGMKRLQLVAKKQEEEAGLQKFIDADPQRKATYGNVLADTKRIYDEMSARAQYELVLDALPTSSLMIRLAGNVVEAADEMAKPSAERTRPYQDASLAETKKASAGNFANYHEEAERRLLTRILTMAANLPKGQRIVPLDEALGGDYSNEAVARWANSALARTTLKTPEGLADAIGKTPGELRSMNDPFVDLATGLAPLQRELRDVRARRTAELSKLSALLIDVKQKYLQKDFIPDANGTLRFTYGRIRGYSPKDAVVMKPITTLAGVIEKTKDEYPYATPRIVRDLYEAKDYGRYKLPKTNELPVAILYNTDTTGGNSGSAVMNAMGELVGVNFDRAWEGTINDYAWNEAYSRSIAVDIRYVLWVTEKVGKATFLLEEMGVTTSGR